MKKLAITILCACSSSHTATPDAPDFTGDAGPHTPIAQVAAGDFVAGHPGVLASISVANLTVRTDVAPAGAVGDDPMLRVFDGKLYIVNRSDTNNVTILDQSTRGLIAQIGTAPGSNPQDVAVLGDTLYVPVYGGAGVAVLSTTSSDASVIDLSADDPDGKPNCVSVYLVGTDLYVACELADDANFFTPRGPGKVYVYDTTAGAVKTSVTMQTVNPFGIFSQLASGDLVIPTVDFSTLSGCVERIVTGPSPAAGGCMMTNTQLAAGFINRIEIDHDTMWVASTSTDYMHASLRSYDMASSTLAAQPLTPDTEMIIDVAVCPDGSLVVSDATMNDSGVRVYKNGHEVTTDAIKIGIDTKSANALVCY